VAQASAASKTAVVVTPDLIWSQTYSNPNVPQVSALAFAPDGQTIVTGHANRTVNLWRASDGALLRSLTSSGYTCGSITSAGYTPDSQLFTATDTCGTRFFTVADGTLVRTVGATNHVAISPDGQYLASTFAVRYSSRAVKLWRVADGSLVWSVTGGGNSVAFAPDGTLASMGRDGIEFWQLADGAKLRTIAGPNTGLAFSPDSQYVAGAGATGGEYPYDSTVEWYRVADGTLVRQLTRTGEVGALAFTPDGQYLFGIGYDTNYAPTNGYIASTNTIRIWRLTDGLAFKTYDLGTDYPGLAGFALAPDGHTFAYGLNATTSLAHMPASTQCTYNVAPTSATFARAGGTGTVAIDTQAGCAWTARDRVDWITIASDRSGTGPGTVTYNVLPDTESVAPGNPYFIHGVIVVAEQTIAIHQDIAPAGPAYYRIYGAVTDNFCGTGISGVTVSLAGAQTASVQTDSYGRFSFDNLPANQSYTITPTKDGYAFSPTSRTIDNLSADYGTTFTTSVNPNPLPSIHGRITDVVGNGLNGIQLQLTGGTYDRSAATDYFGASSGNYAFNCLDAGFNYTVTPTSADYNFVPPSRTFINLTTAQTADFVATPKLLGQVLISEFRLRGPAGSTDEYVELYNNTDSALTINATDGSTGWALATLDGSGASPLVVAVIPNGTTIPARGHYLIANNSAGGYSLPVAPDQSFTTDINDNNGLALFLTAQSDHMNGTNRLDAVGFDNMQGSAAPLFSQGAGLANVATNVSANEQYAYVRKLTSGTPQSTGDNAQDFALVSTTGSVAGSAAQLGAPSPENSASPIQRNAQIKTSLIDPQAGSSAAPNRDRDATPNVCGNSNCALGTLTIRRKFTNKTGQTITALRFRVVDITTLNSPGGPQADLRALSSAGVNVLTMSGTQVQVNGTTLEQTGQSLGGGLNSALTVALPAPLGSGASVNVQFVLGVQQGGTFRFLVNVEAVTNGATSTQKLQPTIK
jgi:hypothetical protein